LPTNLFISFAKEDLEQLHSFRALANNPEHPLEFHDGSEIEPALDKSHQPIRQPPRSPTSKPIRDKLHPLLKKATKMVILVGKNTFESD